MYAQANQRREHDDSTLPESEIATEFWQQWQKHRDGLYRCCLRLMNFNPVDAEDALSQAMLKAWEKAQQFAGKIANFRAWLMQLTRNLCIDIIRDRARSAASFENIEWVNADETIFAPSSMETPDRILEQEEKLAKIRGAIATLPDRLRETFILHFYEDCPYQEIAQQQRISYDNVCKRISEARKILKQKLSSYFLGENKKTAKLVSVASLPIASTGQGQEQKRRGEEALRTTALTTPGSVQEGGREKTVEGPVNPTDLENEDIKAATRVNGELLLEVKQPAVLPDSATEGLSIEPDRDFAVLRGRQRAVVRQHCDWTVSEPAIAQQPIITGLTVCKQFRQGLAMIRYALRLSTIGNDRTGEAFSIGLTSAVLESAIKDTMKGQATWYMTLKSLAAPGREPSPKARLARASILAQIFRIGLAC